MTISVPRNCPWCGKEIIKRTGPEQTALKGMRFYACGTIISLYDNQMQVTSTKHPEEAGWRPYDV